jgi:hypothetical protein
MHYRLYLLTAGGRISTGLDLTCDNVDDAYEAAKQHPHDFRKELWSGVVKLGIFPPNDAPPPTAQHP